MTDETKHAPTLDWGYVPSHLTEGPSEVRHKDGWLVCETCSDSYAMLMAAAPKMLEALREILEFAIATRLDPQANVPAIQAIAEKAIARAEGRCFK